MNFIRHKNFVYTIFFTVVLCILPTLYVHAQGVARIDSFTHRRQIVQLRSATGPVTNTNSHPVFEIWEADSATIKNKIGFRTPIGLSVDFEYILPKVKGITGQVLSLADANTDSTAWATIPGTGDITGVTAGSGLKGGGLSGDVTLDLNPQLLNQTIEVFADSVRVKAASIDISTYTNLSVSSPLLLTGDQIGFDFSTNNTWTGSNAFGLVEADTFKAKGNGGLKAADDTLYVFDKNGAVVFRWFIGGPTPADNLIPKITSGVMTFQTDATGGGGSITVEEADLVPSVASVTKMQFDQADGFTVTDETGGQVQIDLVNAPDAAVADNITLTNLTQITTRNFADMQGTVGDLQIAAGAVDGGPGGEIADGSITTDDIAAATIATGDLAFDPIEETELDSEAELEAQLVGVTNVFTNNDGALADDNLADDAITALSDVAAKTGTGTTVVFSGAPTLAGFTVSGGNAILSDGVGNTPLLSLVPQTGTTWDIYVEDTGDDLQFEVNTTAVETVDFVNIGTGTVNIVIDGTVDGVDISARDHDAVTLAGENYLSIAGQVITANAVNLAGSNVTGILPDANVADALTLSTVSGTVNAGAATSLEIPNGAAPTTDAFGEIAGDNNAWAAGRGAPQFFDGTANTYLVGVLVSDIPTNGQVPKWNTGGTITWEDDATGAGGGDAVSINGAAATDADFDDATPAAPVNSINVKWQSTGVSPTDISANILLTEINQTGTITSQHDIIVAGIALNAQNTTDAASNQILILGSGNRAIPADLDEGYVSFKHDDNLGAQVEYSRLTSIAEDVTSTTKDSRFEFDVMVNNVLTNTFDISGTGVSVTGNIAVTGTVDGTDISIHVADANAHHTPTVDTGDEVSVDGGATTNPDFVSTGDIDFVNTTNTITANINAGSIVNADINGSAAIDMSKTAFVAGTNVTLVGNTLNVDDAFVLNTGDVITGNLDFNDGAGNSPQAIFTPATGTAWKTYTEDATDDYQIESANTVSTETVDIVNPGTGVADLVVEGALTASNFSGTSSGTNTGDQTITLTGDVTGSGTGSFATTISADVVTYAKMQNVSVTQRVLGRNSAGAGDPEEVTFSQFLDWVGSAAQGDILYRNATVWTRLAAGTNGQFLQTQGAGLDPIWATPAGTGDITAVGPVFASGDAFVDGVATSGTTMLVWEGVTVDLNEFSLLAPSADPGADITITFPSATGTLFTDARTITINGTANEISSSAGAQDMSADRTWTLSLPTQLTLSTKELQGGTLFIAEGATANLFETTFNITDPTADRTITFDDADGTVTVLGNVSTGTGGFVMQGTPTITTPVIADFSNSTHTHQNNAGGGQIDHGLALTGLADDDHPQYLLDAGDTATGNLTFSDGVGDSPQIIFTPQTGTSFQAFVEDTGDDLQFQANTTVTETIDFVNIGTGVMDVTVEGALSASNLSGTNTGDQTITLTGDVTGSGTGSFATTIASDAVTNAKSANMAQNTIKMRVAVGAGDPEDIDISTGLTLVTAVAGDFVIIEDATDGGLKRANVSDFLGGGSGDITAVGPAFASGDAFVDGIATSGTTMWVWEGVTVDLNELNILSPSADPGADINITLPSATGNLTMRTAALTNGGLLLGTGTDEVRSLGVAANGQIPIGDGTTDPVLATITGTAGEIDVANGAGSITLSLSSKTKRESIINRWTIPDNSGNVFFEPYSIKSANGRWPHIVLIFNAGTTRDGINGQFTVPQDYVGTANLVIIWTSASSITGDVEWDFEYRAVGGDDLESFDQTLQNESLNLNDTAPSAINERMVLTINLADANFAAGDIVQFQLFRDGTDAGDTMSGSAILFDAYFEYNN